jgi:hypothetical protein
LEVVVLPQDRTATLSISRINKAIVLRMESPHL